MDFFDCQTNIIKKIDNLYLFWVEKRIRWYRFDGFFIKFIL